MTPSIDELRGLLERASPAWCGAMVAGFALRRLRHEAPSPDANEADRDCTLAGKIATAMPQIRTLLSRLTSLEADNAALREAVQLFVRMERSIICDVGTAHNRGPGANSEMRSDDRDMMADLRRAFDLARAALTLRSKDDG